MNTKPGWKTTEFWGKIAIQSLSIAGMTQGFLSPDKATLIIGVLEGIYSIGRAIVKYKGGTLPDIPCPKTPNPPSFS